MKGKTGGGGGEWVVLEAPRPPKVKDIYANTGRDTGELSERCRWWLRQIERGWRPNRRIASECWECSADWYGVYGWEFMDVICPALKNGRLGDFDRVDAERKERKRLSTPLGPKTAEESFKEILRDDVRQAFQEELTRQILLGDGVKLTSRDDNLIIMSTMKKSRRDDAIIEALLADWRTDLKDIAHTVFTEEAWEDLKIQVQDHESFPWFKQLWLNSVDESYSITPFVPRNQGRALLNRWIQEFEEGTEKIEVGLLQDPEYIQHLRDRIEQNIIRSTGVEGSRGASRGDQGRTPM